MATNKDSIFVTNRDCPPAQNKHRNKFVGNATLNTNRRTDQRTESLEIVFCYCLSETTWKQGFVVPCCLHSCDQVEYLVLRNNSFSAPHRCADREGQGVSCEGGDK